MARTRAGRKIEPGRCTVCGCAVVRPSNVEKWEAVGESSGGAWDKPIAESGWANGHQYDYTGKLVRVRCQTHGGLGFPRGPITDSTVTM